MDFINLSSTASTLLITLYSRAYMSSKKMIIEDKKAEEVISNIGYDKKKLKVSTKLQALLTIRAYLMDEYCKNFIKRNNGNCNIIQLGCGLDSRYFRLNNSSIKFYDLDLYGTMEVRKKYFKNSSNYKMITSNVCNTSWIEQIEDLDKPTLFVCEGLFMYLTEEENKLVLNEISKYFPNFEIIMDAFSKLAVSFSKFAPSLKRVNANMNFGFDNPLKIEEICPSLKYLDSLYYYNCEKANDLPFFTRVLFKIRKSLHLFFKVQRIEIYRKK